MNVHTISRTNQSSTPQPHVHNSYWHSVGSGLAGSTFRYFSANNFEVQSHFYKYSNIVRFVFFSTCRPGRAVFPRRTGAVAPSASLLGGLGGWSARSCGTAARDPSASRTTSPSASKILPLTKSRQGYGASSELNTWYRNPHPAPFHRSQPTKHTHTFPITHNRNSSSNRNTQISHKFALTDLLCNNNHNNETSILSPHNSHCAQCTYR